MKILFVGIIVLVGPLLVLAAVPPDGADKLPPSASIRRCYTGAASTYNPRCETDPRERAWGNTTATGIPYNENEWTAAIQLSIARNERCGIGSGGVCYAAVQVPQGRAAIIKITDNGPLAPGRVIDLNEKSMRYLSYEKKGNCSGLIENVRVCLLNGTQFALGPIDEKDAAEWAKRVVGAPEGVVTDYKTPSNTLTGSPYNSLLSSLFGQQQQQSPPLMGKQPGGTQLGQYFSEPYYSSVSGQLFSNSASSSQAGGSSVAQNLLDLLRPSTKTTKEGTTIVVGAGLKGVVSVTPGSATTTIEVTSLAGEGNYPSQTDTFVTTGQPKAIVATQGSPSLGASFASAFDAIKQTLARIVELLRNL